VSAAAAECTGEWGCSCSRCEDRRHPFDIAARDSAAIVAFAAESSRRLAAVAHVPAGVCIACRRQPATVQDRVIPVYCEGCAGLDSRGKNGGDRAGLAGRGRPMSPPSPATALETCALMLRNQGPCRLVDGEWVYEHTVQGKAAELLAAGYFTRNGHPA
jgi:hypothetical protein